MSIIKRHIEEMLHESIYARTYSTASLRKALVTGTRAVQTIYKKLDGLYRTAVMSYPELMTTDELIKMSVSGRAREDDFILTTLSKLDGDEFRTPTPTQVWFRKAYSEAKFGGPLPKEVKPKKTDGEKEEKGIWIKTETLSQIDESIKRKKVKKVTKKKKS